ncbi:MAG TPA: hypothetical protein HA252_03025 [Candidatus Diapherotrites archaeon]|uniref:Roadblock/LC7 domain-containing protein n=1 Tax=Candidatus Iainarchaeum sp. TaxID=3101447 RepID=A0A7J4JF00_9ARCH|nr:hypothetical protein [Candidatus Diapherotrites archaeon]HIH16351.1 hypothetical protein [Candidatus Diapherotrites archaeon]
MSLASFLGFVFRRASGLLLDLDDTCLPVEQLRALHDFSQRHRFEENPAHLQELVSVLKKKHAVDAIIVANRHGSMVVSSEGDLDTEALTGTALFNYVRAEIPDSDAILVRAGNWYMLFPFNEKVYILRAGSSLSTIEMHAIAREVEAFMKAKLLAPPLSEPIPREEA